MRVEHNFYLFPKTELGNVQMLYDASGKGGLVKPSECRHMGQEARPNRHITFIVLKNFNSQFILLYLRYMGEGLVENNIWGEGLAENVRIPSCGGEV